MKQHGWRIIPVNPHADAILGERAYPALREVPGQIGLVSVFRPPEQTPDIAPASRGGGRHGPVAATGHRLAAGTCPAKRGPTARAPRHYAGDPDMPP